MNEKLKEEGLKNFVIKQTEEIKNELNSFNQEIKTSMKEDGEFFF